MAINDRLAQIPAAIARHLAVHGVGQSAPSFFRIAGLAMVLLAVLGRTWMTPPPTAAVERIATAGTWVDMPAPFGDPRGFETPPPKQPGEFRIAWIGDSSSQFRTATGADGRYLANEVLHNAGSLSDGVPSRTLSYVLNGQRPYDIYVCLLDALQHAPDAVVLALNPVWSFERRSILFRRHLLRTAGQHLPAEADDWLAYAALAEPAEWADAVLAPWLPSLQYRHAWHARMALIAEQVQRSYGPAAEMGARIAAWREAHQPVAYTTYPAVFLHDAYAKYARPAGTVFSNAAYTAQQMQVADTAVESMLRLLLDQVVDAGVPTLIYRVPVNPATQSAPSVAAHFLRGAELLDRLAKAYAGDNLRVVSALPSSVVDDLQFVDYIHLREGDQNQALLQRLADELHALRAMGDAK